MHSLLETATGVTEMLEGEACNYSESLLFCDYQEIQKKTADTKHTHEAPTRYLQAVAAPLND